MAFLRASVPNGFTTAVTTLNSLPTPLLTDLCRQTADVLAHRTSSVSIPNLCDSYQSMVAAAAVGTAAGSPLLNPQAAIQGAYDAVSYLFSGAYTEELAGKDLGKALIRFAGVSQAVAEVLVSVWEEKGCATPHPAQVLSVGELVGIDWRLGVAVRSNACTTLKQPYVSMMLHLSGSDVSFEMTIPQFQKMAGSLREMESVIQSI